ncbi:MAG: class I SAM-dependent methyltransferase [Rhodobacterales bacterium]
MLIRYFMPDNTSIKTVTDANRKAWDQSALHHRDTNWWHEMVTTVARPDFSCFDPTMTEALKGIKLNGKSVVQVGCNNGREVLSIPAYGARNVLGIDQSPAFIGQARELGEIAQKPVTFLCANIYDLPCDTPVGFDVAIITIGVLGWMPDLPEFFNVIAKLSGKGGQLIIYETHPFLEVFNPKAQNPYQPEFSYFQTEPSIEEEVITYDGSTHEGGVESYWFTHTPSHIFTSILNAGFHITNFEEFAHSNREVGYAIYENQPAQLPMCYILQADKS